MVPAAAAGSPGRPRWIPAPPLHTASALAVPLVASHGHSLWTEWGGLEWTIVAVGGVISLWVIWGAVRHTFRPGEEASDHVKRSILDDEDRALEPRAPSPASPVPPASPPPPPPSSAPPAPPTTHR